MRITIGSMTIEADDVNGMKELISLMPELSRYTQERGRSLIPCLPREEDEEETLRAEYAASRGLSQVRLTKGILAGRTPLEFLRAWKAGEAEYTEEKQGDGEPIDLETVPV